MIQLGTADREAESAKIGRCVDQSIGFWHLKCAMDVRIRVEELINGTQGQFYLLIAGMCGSERHRADSGSIFVVNSVIQFVQQHAHAATSTFPVFRLIRYTCVQVTVVECQGAV